MNETTKSELYNGWTNYETWCVNLWITNDEVTYHRMIRARDVAELRSRVEESVLSEEATLREDLLGNALDNVNWLEIYEALHEV